MPFERHQPASINAITDGVIRECACAAYWSTSTHSSAQSTAEPDAAGGPQCAASTMAQTAPSWLCRNKLHPPRGSQLRPRAREKQCEGKGCPARECWETSRISLQLPTIYYYYFKLCTQDKRPVLSAQHSWAALSYTAGGQDPRAVLAPSVTPGLGHLELSWPLTGTPTSTASSGTPLPAPRQDRHTGYNCLTLDGGPQTPQCPL